jgi:hypothetical protein
MNNATKVDQAAYVWVITETINGEDTFVGMSDPEGASFLPVCESKEEALMLMGRLPKGEGQRQAEAIHKQGLLTEAQSEGFAVYLIDSEGTVKERLDQTN